MTQLTESDMIWNRACGEDPLRTLPGDRALADLLRAHGLVMNGGVLHAVECLAVSELTDAQCGYRYFGLETVAALLSRAKTILEADDDSELIEQELDQTYLNMIPDDDLLVERFEQHWQRSPSEYAPLRGKDKAEIE